jgi:hypothetical protein
MLEKLNKQFNDRYFKQLEALNNNLYKAAKDDNGYYEVPVPDLGEGGFTEVEGKSEGFSLSAPALATVVNKKVKGKTTVYRVAVSLSEASIAADKPEYFNFLFDRIMRKALSNYYKKYGDANQVRFGSYFIKVLPLQTLAPNPGSNADDQVEIRFLGDFAGTEEV